MEYVEPVSRIRNSLLLRVPTLFRWDPGVDTLLAGISILLMWAVFYLNAQYAETNRVVLVVLFMLFGNVVLNVLAPAWYVVRRRGEPISELGIRFDRWPLSVAISVGIAVYYWPDLARVAEQANLSSDVLLRQVLMNALVFWEVFFVFGWLQLRFERAFGVVPAIVLAAFGFATYHIGTFPLDEVLGLAGVGVIFASLFRVTRNILALIPFAWAVVCSIGTIPAGFIATWEAVAAFAIVVTIQLLGLAWIARRPQS